MYHIFDYEYNHHTMDPAKFKDKDSKKIITMVGVTGKNLYLRTCGHPRLTANLVRFFIG
jgi:hypothetical protein